MHACIMHLNLNSQSVTDAVRRYVLTPEDEYNYKASSGDVQLLPEWR